MPGAYDAIAAPTAAYGFRRLRNAYASNVAATLVGTTTTQIGFASGTDNVDRGAIASALGTTSLAALSAWYDQSGNSRNLGTAGTGSAGAWGNAAQLGRRAAVCVAAPGLTSAAQVQSMIGVSGDATAISVVSLNLITSTAAPGSGSVWNNTKVWGDNGGYVGLASRVSSGVYYLQAFNWGSSEAAVEVAVTRHEPIFAVWRRKSSKVGLSVNGSAWVEATITSPTLSTGVLTSGAASNSFYLGEQAFWTSALSDADLSTLRTAAASHWGGDLFGVSSSGGSTIQAHRLKLGM